MPRDCCVVPAEGAVFCCGGAGCSPWDGLLPGKKTAENIILVSEMQQVPAAGNTLGVSLGYPEQLSSCQNY